MKNILVSLLMVGLVGCGSVPVDPATAKRVPVERIVDQALTTKAPGKVEVIVKRDRANMGMALDARLYLDGKHIATVSNGEVISLYLDPKSYLIGVKLYGNESSDHPVQEVPLDTSSGTSRVYRIFGIYGTGFTIQPSSF